MIIGVGASVFVISILWSERILNFLHQKSLGSRDIIIKRMESMFIESSEKQLTYLMLLLSFGLGFIVFLFLWPSVFFSIFMGSVVTIIGWQIPKWGIEMLYQKRCSKFVAQMVDGLTIMSNGIRSGLSITQSMERVAESMPNPISQEFDLALSKVRLGVSIEEALNDLAQRIPEPDVQMLVMAINILKETGGDLASTFSTITDTIRERHKLHQKIDALTAQGKMQGIIMAIIPFVLLVVFSVIDLNFIGPLFSTTLGRIFILIMLALQITGGIFIRKVVTIKV
ncbi:MAG: type II secretion system F family protein [Bdellovibrionales bacterium]|nr:type II secretion system F family protein [Bdellovibrionales bacterium]